MLKSYSKIKKIQQRNEEPTNATGMAVVGTGDDSSVVKKKKKKKSPWDKYSPDALGRQFHMEDKKKKKKLKSTRVVGEKPDKELSFWEDRNYRKEYDNYHKKPDQRERNAGRLRARRLMAKLGKVSKGDKMDVHHKDNDPMNNEKGNLSVTTQKYNRTEPRLREDDAVAVEPNITPDDKFAGVDVFKVGDTEYNNCKLGKRKYARWDKYVDIETDTGKKIVGYAKKYPNKSIIVQHDKTDHMLYLKKFEKGEE